MPLTTLALAATLAATPATPAAASGPENLLRGPARCVLRYLEAVRLAGPRAAELRAPPPRGRASRESAGAVRVPAREEAYAAAKRYVAPRALDAVSRWGGGAPHPLAPWEQAARGEVLESFQLQAVRRAPRGAAVVTVRERWWRPAEPDPLLTRSESEFLVARVGGAWKVVDRRPGRTFRDAEIENGYPGWFDEPGAAAQAQEQARTGHGRRAR